MITAYERLHALGHAHSIESYHGARLAGGLYGVHLGSVFFGESMFSVERDASKVALARLVKECASRDIRMIDCQVASPHLESLGAREISRREFTAHLRNWTRPSPGKWA